MNEGIIPGAGRMLAEAREAKGLSVAQVAEKLKLTTRQIEALEAEDFGRLPAVVFVRGFIRNYARLLEIPASDLLGDVPVPTEPTETITAPSEGLSFGTSSMKRWLLLPLAVFVLFLLLVALLYAWLSRGEEAYIPEVPVQPVTQPAVPILPLPEAAPPPPLDSPDSGTPTGQAVPVTPPAGPAAVTPAPAPTQPQPAPQPAPPLRQDPVPVSGGAALQFQASEDAWIEVMSGDNRRFARLLRAGEQLTLRGTPPFRLVVGNAANVRMAYNGRGIDLKPYTGEKVARLTLE